MPARHDQDIAMLERGEIFYYRLPDAAGVEQLHVILRPQAKHRARLASLQAEADGGLAGRIVAAERDGPALVTQVEALAGGITEPVAAGVYRLLRHGDHTLLLQSLDPADDMPPTLPAEAAWRIWVDAPPVPQQPVAFDTERPGLPLGAVPVPGTGGTTDAEPPDRLDQEETTLRLRPLGDDEAGTRLGLEDLMTDLRFERDHQPRRALDDDTADLPQTGIRRSPFKPSGY